MTHDRRERVEAARDRFHTEAQSSATLCLHGEAEGVALDLTRMAEGARGAKVLASILDALGAADAAPFILAVAGDGSPLGNSLGALAQSVRTERIESGADDLAIGFPWLEGRIADGTLVRAPLFLYPASLTETREGPWAWTLEIGGAPWLNEPLAALFRRLTRVRLTYEDFLAHDEDGLFRHDDATWQGLIKTLQRAGVTLADTAKVIPATPTPFDTLGEAMTNKIPPGQLRLQNHLVLGRFPMLAAGTASDFEALLQGSLDGYALGGAAGLFEVPADDPGFVGRAPGRRADDAGPFGLLRRWQVLPTDPHQEEALRCIEDLIGDNDGGLVVIGPPGTGRSQLLANAVAGAIHKGLKVLVTSPRRAALDDVAFRLAGVGLGEPLALVHDPWRDRNPLCHGIAESVDPIVSDLIAPPDTRPDQSALAALEKALSARLDAADRAYDALTGGDGGHPGLAELDESALVDDIAVPDLTDCCAELTRDDLGRALPEVQRLAPQAAKFVVPHPLAARSDWGALSAADIKRFYADIGAARQAIEQWALAKAVLAPADLERHRKLIQKTATPIVKLALDDDPAALQRHAEVVSWCEDPVPQDVHTRFLEELRSASQTLQWVPHELIRLPPKELAERIANLDKLAKMEGAGLRHFSPAFWSLKKLPEKYTATLPPETPKEPGPLCELHREAEKWQRLLASLPDDAAFRLSEVGEVYVLQALVQRLDEAFEICRAEEMVVQALGALGFPARPNWDALLKAETFTRAASPFLVALADEHARVGALEAVYTTVERLKVPLDSEVWSELRSFARDRPAAAEGRLGGLAATEAEAAAVLSIDQATAKLPTFVGRFLRVWNGPASEARIAARRAVEEGWRTLRIGDAGPTTIEAPLVDPRELRALGETLTQLEAARVKVVVGRWKTRVHGLTELETQRQDLVKLVNEAGRKRLRATLRQIVERYWKRGLGVLRPAWFAPLDAVASIFPRDRDTFDLVIIDEAHRASLGAAMPALLRSRRVLLLGDPCQAIPAVPTSVQGIARDSFRSVLPLGRGVWPQTSLWWGWGVRRDELWEFPNAGAYAGAVLVVPNAEKRPRAKCEGLRWTKVEGRWHEGTNKAEADKVVDIIAEAFADRIGDDVPSIGVVAATVAQAALIRRQIDRRAARDEGFRAALRQDRERPDVEQLFVGDLQRFLVDTRDVMIMSLTYATTDTSKRLQTDYGQLAEFEGENFLTGVITRARVGLHVVCSFHDVALDAGRQQELGPKMLDALVGFTHGVALGDDRIADAALARLKAATGIEQPAIEPAFGVGQVVRERVREPLVERGLGVALELLPGPAAPDMTVAPTQKSLARVGIQTTRFLMEPDAFVRDVWSRRLWQRQGWALVRLTPGVWRASPAGVIRSLEKLFSLSPKADAKIVEATERRLEQERQMAELAAERLAEQLRWAAEAEAEAAARWAAEAAEAPAPEPEPVPEPEEAPSTGPESVSEPEEAPSTGPESVPDPDEAPSTGPESVPEPDEAPSTGPESVRQLAEGAPSTGSESVPEPPGAPSTGSESVPEPLGAPSTDSESVPEPVVGSPAERPKVSLVRPLTRPTRQPPPVAARPKPTPQIASAPPEPTPEPEPTPAPAPEPTPAPAPEPTPAPAPEPTPAPKVPTRPPVPRPPTAIPRPPPRPAPAPTPSAAAAPAPAAPAPAAPPAAAPVRASIPMPPPRPPTATALPTPPKPNIALPPKPGSIPRPPTAPAIAPAAPPEAKASEVDPT